MSSMMHRALSAALVLVSATTACRFARPGMDMPLGHRRFINSSLSSSCTIPGCYTTDPTHTAVTNFVPTGCGSAKKPACSNWGHLQTTGFIESLVRLAQYYNNDLCYWSFQSLPPPPQHETNFTDADASMIYSLGTAANTEIHRLVGNGVFEGGLATSGNLVNRNLCKRGVLRGERLLPKV